MALSVVQSKIIHVALGNVSSTGSMTVTLDSPTTAGNLLVCGLGQVGYFNTTFSLPAGWSAVTALNPPPSFSGRSGTIAYYPNVPGGLTSFTFTFDTGNGGIHITTVAAIMAEVTPMTASAALDQEANDGETGNLNATTASTSVASELAAGYVIVANSVVVTNSGWTLLSLADTDSPQTFHDAFVLKELTTTQTVTLSTSSGGSQCVAVVATFSGTTPPDPFPAGYGHPDGWSGQCQLHQLLGGFR